LISNLFAAGGIPYEGIFTHRRAGAWARRDDCWAVLDDTDYTATA
jgi:hypothetical protein